MLFHSHEFLALLCATLALFHLLPSWRRHTLLAASILFYAYAGLGMLALFIAVSAFAYLCLRGIERGHPVWMPIGVAGILANLLFFKYAAFLLDSMAALGVAVAPAQDWAAREIVLPVGISFYSFQLIAILVDAWRGQRLDVRSFRELLLFIMFFGHLIAGPIMRGREFFPQLHEFPGPAPAQVHTGVLLLLAGLIKKVVFADYLLAPRVDALFAGAGQLPPAAAWLAPMLFGFQIYFDFSGYVDMALGMAKLFGLELRPNFNTPYLSRTPSEFWGRWNITLSRWFGDYVYVPLGGSRVGLGRTLRNVLVTMLLSGVWHGAGWTFALWGAVHGLYLAAFHLMRALAPRAAAAVSSGPPVARALGWSMTYLVTTIAWVYFRSPGVTEAHALFGNMLGSAPAAPAMPVASGYAMVMLLLLLHALESRWIAHQDRWSDRVAAVWHAWPGPVQALAAFPLLVIVVAITKVVRGAFIYFQF